MKICWFFVATNDTQGSPTKGNQYGGRYTAIKNNQMIQAIHTKEATKMVQTIWT